MIRATLTALFFALPMGWIAAAMIAQAAHITATHEEENP